MNYNEFLVKKENILNDNPDLINLAENNFYNYLPNNIEYDGSGHINGIVYRCHLVEDWLNYYSLSAELKKNIGVSNGVRHSIETLVKEFSNKKFMIPADVYPFYQKTLNDNKIEYSEYKTLNVESLFDDIEDEIADVMLLTDPLKPLGRDINKSEYLKISKWLSKDEKRILMVDSVYTIHNELNEFIFELYKKTNQVILMYSLSKSWCLPNHFGITIFPQNSLGQELREVYKKLDKNQDKLNLAYMALNKYKEKPSKIKNIIEQNHIKIKEYIDIEHSKSIKNPSYMYYTKISFDEFLEKGILVIPASVFGCKDGSIVSLLI